MRRSFTVSLLLSIAACTSGSDGPIDEGEADAAPLPGATDARPAQGPDAGPAAMCTPRPIVAPGTNFFVDVSVHSGIQAGNFIANPPMPIPINDHSRLAVADLDGDGWDDLIMHSLFPNPQAGVPFEHLIFINKHDGTFRDASDESGLRAVQAGFFAFGDVDNDGDVDVFAGLDIPLTGFNNQIYLNDGHGKFTLLPNSGVQAAGTTTTANAVFADFNGDGKLDLFLGNGQTSYVARNKLYFGVGDGKFTDVTAANLGTPPAQPTNGLVACDYDNDGDLDVFVSTYGVSTLLGANQMWENDGHGKFTNVAQQRGFASLATGNYWLSTTGMGTALEPNHSAVDYMGSNGFGLDCVDVNGDGNLDIYLTAISHPVDSDYSRKWSDPTQLLINKGQAAGYIFENQYLARGLPFNEGDVDGSAIDFDNDGRVDLAVSRDNKYEGGYTAEAQKSWFGLMHQLSDGKFESIGVTSGINDANAVPARMKAAQNHAWLDFDHDGDLDLLVGGRDHGGGRPNFLLENRAGSKNGWLALRLHGDGSLVNRDAIGARVTVRGGGKIFRREVKSTRGTYDSVDTWTLHFGVGDLGCDYTVEVRWPNGHMETFTAAQLPLGHYAQVSYPATIVVQ